MTKCILCAFSGSLFAATAACSAHNKSTGQFFSANGSGDSQAAASQDAQNTVMQICKQSSNVPDDCELGGCSAMQ